ncbi:sigma-70 family RNA polymerase sigma factor [Arthrobacter sp. JSM 101049]|uniref:sigma-70 family RNA polymerase sigma factor n=1 Tax=Arthrobacter sp. JSM 101049 TaxID=929097 RepID=UPI003563FD78
MRNQMVVDNLPLVGYLAAEMCAKATHLSREDLASVGSIALVTAADSFDPALGVPFGAYARRRIVGAFADDMRSSDWATRGARKRIKETKVVQETLTAALGRTPTTAELAQSLGVAEDEVHAAMQDAARTVVGIDDVMADYLVAETETPEQRLLADERTAMVRAAVEVLPEKMRHIVQRIYFDGSTVKEVAAELGITHSAVSQQRSEAMRLLRDGMQTHYADSEQIKNSEPVSRVAAQRRTNYLAAFGEQAAGGITRTAQAVHRISPAAAAL